MKTLNKMIKFIICNKCKRKYKNMVGLKNMLLNVNYNMKKTNDYYFAIGMAQGIASHSSKKYKLVCTKDNIAWNPNESFDKWEKEHNHKHAKNCHLNIYDKDDASVCTCKAYKLD